MTVDYETLLALLPYLDEYDAEVVELLIDEQAEVSEISDVINKCLTSRQKADILDRMEDKSIEEVFKKPSVKYLQLHRYSPAVREAMECYEYLEDIPDEEDRKWIKQFYHEYYANGSFGIEEEDRVLKTDDLIREATRNNHSLQRDAFSVSSTLGRLTYIEDHLLDTEDQTDKLTWEDMFKMLGYKPAIDKIFNDAVVNINNAVNDERIGLHLLQFYIRMTKLRRMNQRDQKVRGKFNKEKK